ncbi:hypothetical protein [Spiroplasma eriocheiris]|uniref:Transmembrane protein n=1 Tax=Spiroplasma eriocheiris TaxID=315358 RepID=A0A0H3XN07_9MOLU|nr:hypothetical protein [Spiroplasma eriocheiris]AHF58056.1 hypothetical protein SPE_0936 [Spiroplasma eriocheiris CCTCC M 207170]AKM54497.1 hypothetical protein SERIO_v1c09370 [Spiroplasma eriocheiris]
MKKLIQLIFSSIILAAGIISIILFAQLYIKNDIVPPIGNYNFDNVTDAYTGVAVLMGIAAGCGILMLITNLIFLKGNMWVGINALGALAIGAVVMGLSAYYVSWTKNPDLSVSGTTLRSVMILPMLFSGIIVVPSCIGYVLAFKD